MTRVGLSWTGVANRFAAHMWGSSIDGLVHSDGDVLCVYCRPLARWEGEKIRLSRIDCLGLPTDLGVFVQGYIRQHQKVQEEV